MRRIQIERRRGRLRRCGDQRRITLEEDLEREEPGPEELLHLDRALTRLEERDPQMGYVVKLRYFAGLTAPETAEALAISSRTVDRLWSAARAGSTTSWSRQTPTMHTAGGRHAAPFASSRDLAVPRPPYTCRSRPSQ